MLQYGAKKRREGTCRLSEDLKSDRLLEGVASGDVEGTGCWRFSADGLITEVRYDWTVRTTKLWMNALAHLTRPLIDWNHDGIMQEGGEALARLLHAKLIEASHG